MRRYNKDKRATYKQYTRKIKIYDTRDGCDGRNNMQHIHISIRYDGQRHTQYDKGVFIHKTQSKAQKYVNITNAINDTFPDINAPHNAHTYRANCEYHTFIPQHTDYRAPEDLNNAHSTYEDTRTAKCVIFNAHDKVIYYGWMRRTIHIDRYGKHHADVKITLHKGDRNFEVHTYIPLTDTIKGVSIQELRKNDVELYHI